MCVYPRTKFQVSSIILGSFRQGVLYHSHQLTTHHPPPLPQNKPLKSVTNFKSRLFPIKNLDKIPTSEPTSEPMARTSKRTN